MITIRSSPKQQATVLSPLGMVMTAVSSDHWLFFSNKAVFEMIPVEQSLVHKFAVEQQLSRKHPCRAKKLLQKPIPVEQKLFKLF